jgi:UDPglucose 6-dehydrogenase
LREGILPIYEPHVDQLFQLYRKNLTFGSDLALAMRDADAIFVTVGTPAFLMEGPICSTSTRRPR